MIDYAFYNTGHIGMKQLDIGTAFDNIALAKDKVPEAIFYYTGGPSIIVSVNSQIAKDWIISQLHITNLDQSNFMVK